MFREVKGNLLDMFDEGKFHYIIHGCNCFNTLGEGKANGIAGQIGERYTQTKISDNKTEKGDWQKLGNWFDVLIEYEKDGKQYIKTIINAYTQYFPGKNFEYSALIECLKSFSKWLNNSIKEDQRKNITIGLPLIGCGIGGGEWEIVKQIIVEYLSEYDITIVHYEKTQ